MVWHMKCGREQTNGRNEWTQVNAHTHTLREAFPLCDHTKRVLLQQILNRQSSSELFSFIWLNKCNNLKRMSSPPTQWLTCVCTLLSFFLDWCHCASRAPVCSIYLNKYFEFCSTDCGGGRILRWYRKCIAFRFEANNSASCVRLLQIMNRNPLSVDDLLIRNFQLSSVQCHCYCVRFCSNV